MAIKLPPPPILDDQTNFSWLDWHRQVQVFVKSAGTTANWVDINFTGSNITDIVNRDHSNLQGIQGGSAGERYHLTSNEVRNARNTIDYTAPSTGFSQTISNAATYLIIEPAGTLATGTVTMPASPVDGQVVTIASTQTITALTHNPNTGQTLKGALTTIAADTNAAWLYKTSTTTWYRVS